jgi:hypothetical protein
MPIISKYSNDEINNLVEEIISTIQKQKAPVDLALIAMGNAVSNIIEDNVAEQARAEIAKSFADALVSSIKDSAH